MTKENDQTAGNEGAQTQMINRFPVTIISQYIKDLSFENPNAPDVLKGGQGRPSMDVDFSMEARKVEMADYKNAYEVTLGVRAAAERAGKPAFLVEIQYAVLAAVGEEIEEEHLHPLLLIEMPRLAFPFVRQIVAELTQQAGFVPLLLQPIDFRAFYAQRFAQNPPVRKSA